MCSYIVVLSDTHMPGRAEVLPTALLHAISAADLVIHLGDFSEIQVLEYLRGLAPLESVHGNVDSEEVRAILPAQRRITVSGRTLALIHGHRGGPTALAAARSVRGVDAVLFGHSHQPWNETKDGILLFNPGSPTDRRRAPARTFGTLDIRDTIVPSLISLP